MEKDFYDVYLLDYRLGGHTGLELLHEAAERNIKTPLIFLTGYGDHRIDLEAMKAGAADYLVKDQINAPLLERSIRYAIERKHSEDAIRKHKEHLEEIVEERTAELRRANEKLTRIIKELESRTN